MRFTRGRVTLAMTVMALASAAPAMADASLVPLPGSAASFVARGRVVARVPARQIVAFTVYLRLTT
jgi:hypothetical protein